MSMRYIIGVNRMLSTEPFASEEICLFEGEMLADQYIDALYRATWTEMQKSGGSGGSTLDRWKNDDYYSETPLFFKSKHELWSNVPSDVFRVSGHYDVPGVIHPLIPGVKNVVFHDTAGADEELLPDKFDPRFESKPE